MLHKKQPGNGSSLNKHCFWKTNQQSQETLPLPLIMLQHPPRSTKGSCWSGSGPQHRGAGGGWHNTFRSLLTGIKTPPLELRADSDYLVNLLEGPLFSPAPPQCQKHSVHLISSPRRADIKESVYWYKAGKWNRQAHKAPAYKQKGKGTAADSFILDLLQKWSEGGEQSSLPISHLCPDLLPGKRLSFPPGTGTHCFWTGTARQCSLAFTPVHTQYGTDVFFFTLLFLFCCLAHATELKLRNAELVQAIYEVRHCFIPL